MTGFDASWLDLREPADHAARNRLMLAAVAGAFAGRAHVAVADLGSGSGSTLRALSPHLGPSQDWTLLDNDPALLAHARTRLSAWADEATEHGGALLLRRGETCITLRTEVVDLGADPLPPAAIAADLVTASALFDLVAEPWLNRFMEKLSASGKPLYAALNYQGGNRFEPPHPEDEEVVAAFNRHQTIDKGFGAALGPSAAMTLGWLATRAGFSVNMGESVWRLGTEDDRELAGELLTGIASAVMELDDPPAFVKDWLGFRLAVVGRVEVDHADVFLTPPA